MKKALIIAFILIVSVKVYFSLTVEKRVGPEINPIELAAFDIPDLKDEKSIQYKKESIKAIKGVTACAINSETKIAAITYDPKILNVEMIKSFLNYEFQEEIKEHQYPISDKVCPVHEPGKYFSNLFK